MGIEPGRVLAARYRAEQLLGRGGMGEVWQCLDLIEDRHVAVKTVLAKHLFEPWVRRLFQAEVVAVARLSHPSIVEIYDLLEEDDGSSLLVMAYRAGRSLDHARPLIPAWSFVRSILVQLLDALAHAHARNVLHLDIKPANVIVERGDRGAARATLVDFGIARMKAPGRAAESWMDRDGVFGTLEYMAPEQFRGQLAKLGPWTDLYALGVMAFDLCCGTPPHASDNPLESARKRATTPPPSLVPTVNVPIGFRDVCARLLALSPSDRYACAADVLAELERIDPQSRSALAAVTFDDPAENGRASATSIPTVSTSSELAAETGPESAPTQVAALGDDRAPAPVRVAREAPSGPGSSKIRAEDAEKAFTADRGAPTPGAYGLFGLRELPVLGRIEERRHLWDSVATASLKGRPRAVLLEGPAGTGKSRLARDAAERSLEIGLCTVLSTHWSAGGSPDEGLRGMVENALESRGSVGDSFTARLEFWLDRTRAPRDAFVREVGVLLRPPPGAAPDAGLPVRVAVDTLTRTAAQRPVLLWLDDVQWSRGEASRFIRALAELPALPPVCILATVRDDELGDGVEHRAILEALSKLCGREGVVRIPMQPLDEAATRSLVRGLLDLEPELTDVITRRSEGNPLFVTQLVGQLVGERAIERRGARYSISGTLDIESVLPSDMSAVWARRIAVSGAFEHDLQTLAIVRERVAEEVVTELYALAGESFAHSVDRALSSGLIRKDGELYAFSHGLLRQYLIRTLPAAAQAQLSAIAAQALAPLVGRDDVQEERAHHLRRAGENAEAAEALLDASLWSWRRAEHDRRKPRLETLCEWARDDGATAIEGRSLSELASLHAELGHHDEANRSIAAAASLPANTSDYHAAWIHCRHAQVLRLQGRSADANGICTTALDLARRSRGFDVEALLLGQLALDAKRQGRPDLAADLYDGALEASRRAGNRATEAQVAAFRASLCEPVERERRLRSALEMARTAGALRVETMIRQMWCESLYQVGEGARARTEISDVAADASRLGLRQIASLAALQASCWAIDARDWAAARAHRDQAATNGADDGALPERAHAAAIDVVLALVETDASCIEDAARKLGEYLATYKEKSFVKLVEMIRSIAPDFKVGSSEVGAVVS